MGVCLSHLFSVHVYKVWFHPSMHTVCTLVHVICADKCVLEFKSVLYFLSVNLNKNKEQKN